MKKPTLLLLAFMLCFLAACNGSELESTTTSQTSVESSTVDYGSPVLTPPEKIIQIEENDIQEVLPYERQYRYIYYRFDSIYYGLVDWDEANKFADEFLEQNPFEIEISEMFLVTFIKRFDIPKEEFERALTLDWNRGGEYMFDMAAEENEMPNPDILYTFNNDIIHAYYRRKSPIEPDWAESKTYKSYSAYLEENPE